MGIPKLYIFFFWIMTAILLSYWKVQINLINTDMYPRSLPRIRQVLNKWMNEWVMAIWRNVVFFPKIKLHRTWDNSMFLFKSLNTYFFFSLTRTSTMLFFFLPGTAELAKHHTPRKAVIFINIQWLHNIMGTSKPMT